MDIKQRVLLILCKTIYKPVRLEKSDVIKTVFVHHSNVQYIKETTFNVLKVKVNGEYKTFELAGNEYIDFDDLKYRATGNEFLKISDEEEVPFE